MAITNATVVPVVIAARLLAAYSRRRVYTQRTNRAWQGQLANGGDRVRLNTPSAGSVSDYTAGGTITYRSADASHAGDIVINKFKSFAVDLDDIHDIQSNTDLLDAAVAEDGKALAEAVDVDVFTEMYAGASAGVSAIALDHDTATLSANDFMFASINRIMDLAKMPRDGRWLAIGPYTAELVQKYALANPVVAAPANENLRNGLLGNYAGLNIYVDGGENSSLDTTNATNHIATERMLYGNDSAVAFIDQVREIEEIRRESTFATAVRGLYGYGIKTVWSSRIHKTTITISNVP